MDNAAKRFLNPEKEVYVIGNESKFQEIHDEFRLRVIRYMTRMVGEQDAEDLTQEVFIKVSQALPAFRGESSLSTWIYRIATNTALDRLRSKSFKIIRKEDLSYDAGAENFNEQNILADNGERSAEQQAIRWETNACIRNIIDRLPETYRTVIVLGYLEGLQDSEIAQVFGLSLQAAKIRLHRARERLRKELSERCVFYRDEENEFTCDVKSNGKEAT